MAVSEGAIEIPNPDRRASSSAEVDANDTASISAVATSDPMVLPVSILPMLLSWDRRSSSSSSIGGGGTSPSVPVCLDSDMISKD